MVLRGQFWPEWLKLAEIGYLGRNHRNRPFGPIPHLRPLGAIPGFQGVCADSHLSAVSLRPVSCPGRPDGPFWPYGSFDILLDHWTDGHIRLWSSL